MKPLREDQVLNILSKVDQHAIRLNRPAFWLGSIRPIYDSNKFVPAKFMRALINTGLVQPPTIGFSGSYFYRLTDLGRRLLDRAPARV